MLPRGNTNLLLVSKQGQPTSGVQEGRQKHVMVGLLAKTHLHKMNGKWGLSRDDPHAT